MVQALKAPKSKEFPVVVERGPTGLKGTAKIYFDPVNVKGQRYDSFLVTHYSLGKCYKQRFNDYSKAFSPMPRRKPSS